MGQNKKSRQNKTKYCKKYCKKENINYSSESKKNKTVSFNIASWNIRRGFYSKELEITEILEENKIHVLGLQEIDLILDNKCAPQIKGFDTVLQSTASLKSKIRVILFIKEDIRYKVRTDLMSPNFPSIWIEVDNLLVCTFYREWSPEGNSSMNSQLDHLRILTEQWRRAVSSNKETVALGDMNLCSQKWDDESFPHKKLASEVKGALAEGGFYMHDTGITYIADHCNKDGTISKSSLDHVYTITKNEVSTQTLESAASDHLPIMVRISKGLAQKRETNEKKAVRKMKNIDWDNFRYQLAMHSWEWLVDMDVDDQVKYLEKFILDTLDLCAPIKMITVHKNYKSSLTSETKSLMKKRNKTRRMIKISSGQSKMKLLQEYRSLRNECIKLQRKDQENFYLKRFNQLAGSKEIWDSTKHVLAKKGSKISSLKVNNEIIEDDSLIAKEFGEFFIKKVDNLKKSICNASVIKKYDDNNDVAKKEIPHLKLHPVSEEEVKQEIIKLKNKASKGLDDIDSLIIKEAIEVLIIPLTMVINSSIISCTFPKRWKEARISPIHKKGDKENASNYRPVSILCVMSKVLESVIRKQIMKHCLSYELIPESQHGFMPARSTLTSLIKMQDTWLEAFHNRKSTGILLFDLSAAFDTIDKEVLMKKLKTLSFDVPTIKWINSFMTGRTQQIKIGESISEKKEITSGVPQGSILGPLLFILYTSDVEQWLSQKISVFTYADDTVISYSDVDENKIKNTLETEANAFLQYCADNGLVANPSKSEFLFIKGQGRRELSDPSIKVGDNTIMEAKKARILGVLVNNKLRWSDHIEHVKTAVRQKTAMLKRLKYHLPRTVIPKLVDSMIYSNVRYCLPLFAKPRISEEEPVNDERQSLQVLLNNALRMVLGVKRRDRVSNEKLHEMAGTLSLNRMSITAIQKIVKTSLNGKGGLKNFFLKNAIAHESHVTRSMTDGKLQIPNHQDGFRWHAIRIWNKFGENIVPDTLPL